MIELILTCAFCGEEFISLNKKKYCSRECLIEAMRRQVKRTATKVCKMCGKEFKIYQNKQYCSRECYNKAVEKHEGRRRTIIADAEMYVRIERGRLETHEFKTLLKAVNFLSAFTDFETREVLQMIESRAEKIGSYKIFYGVD